MRIWSFVVTGWIAALPAYAGSMAFESYVVSESFELPEGARVFDSLPDGRIVMLSGDDVYRESQSGSRVFQLAGTLPSADIASFGAAFLRVSPDGSKLAVGNNGGEMFDNFQVGVFNVADLSGTWFSANHFDAEWFDDTRLAVTAGDFVSPSVVTLLDTTSVDPQKPVNPTVIANIGGASAGVSFDSAGNLFTGNGFQTVGPSVTGELKAFDQAAWLAAAGGTPLDFENDGTLVVDLLSASYLGFDAEGNLHVGGGDFISGDLNYAALVRSAVVAAALQGAGPINPGNANDVRRFDPDAINDSNFYTVNSNAARGEIYLSDSSSTTVFVLSPTAQPAPAITPLGSVLTAALFLTTGGILLRLRPRTATSQRTAGGSCTVCGILASVIPARASDSWADAVVAAHPSFSASGLYDDPASVLGSPATVVYDTMLGQQRVVSLLSPALNRDVPNGRKLVTTINAGQFIKVRFDETIEDDPRNPFGVDFIVFGNSFFVGEDFVLPDTDLIAFILRAGIFAEPIQVSVSQTGIGDPRTAPEHWHTYSEGPFADALFPTNAFEWNSERGSWGNASDFTVPVDPSIMLEEFEGIFASEAIERYGCSGGGTGFDLAKTPFESIQFVYLTGHGGEVDALADVFPTLGDSDRDGDVDLADVAQFQIAFAEPIGPAGTCGFRFADCDGSLWIDLADHRLMAAFLDETR